MKILEIKNFSFSYKENLVLENISISIDKGECVGLIGANGAGKTTLIKAIENYSLYKEYIELYITMENKVDMIRTIHDTPIVYPFLSGSDYVKYVLKLKNLYEKKQIDLIPKFQKNFGLSESMNSLIKDYSFGMKRKIYFLPIFLENPNILLLDEPTNGLDTQSKLFVKQFLLNRKFDKKSTFIASHDINFLENICDRVYVLNSSSISGEYISSGNVGLEKYYLQCLDN